ncbi:ABC transporter permease [Tersicoccus sp. MR15.9]|uniref:ABC transporter permease n=1 Tax=Tersicoccus mangrovi TaxID=3121635 RepID=UPI002FE6579F
MNGRVGALLRRRESGVLLAVVLVIAVTTAINPSFLFSDSGYANLLLTPSILAVLAIAQTFVIVTRNIDLSVSATLGLTAFATGTMFSSWTGVPAVVVVVLAIALGGALGLLNGVLISVAKVPALVITLGTLYAYRGIQVIWQGSSLITPDEMPDGFTNLGVGSVLGVPVLAIVALLVLLGAGYFLGFRRAGREFYAIGSDEQAARLYGLPVGRRVLIAFVLSGLLSGLAGVMYAARYATVSSSAGTGLELQAVAAAVIGGVAIFGGSGTPLGAVLGAVLLTTISSTLPTIGVPDFWQQAVVGALILLAIVLDRVLAARTARRLTSEQSAARLDPAPTTKAAIR